MTALGVFRDDYYNAISVLPHTQYTATAQASGTLAASAISGAGESALTIDTAINIIANIQIAVANAYKQGLGGFAAGVNPPPGVPNLFNVVYTLVIVNTNAGTLTLTAAAGSGVTLTGTATVLAGAEVTYQVTINSPTTVTIQRMYSTVTATFTA